MDAIATTQVQSLIRWLKNGPPGCIAITNAQCSFGSLRAVTWEDAGDPVAVELLERWHSPALSAVAGPNPCMRLDARRWLCNQILDSPERLLFWVRDVAGNAVGHVGLGPFDIASRSVGIRNVACGDQGSQILVNQAIETLRGWVSQSFGMIASYSGPSLAAA